MALRKTLAQRFRQNPRIRSKATAANPSLLQRLLIPSPPPPPQEQMGFLSRVLLQSRSIFQSSSMSPERLAVPIGEKLIERLKGLNGDRIRLDALVPPPIPPDRTEEEEKKKLPVISVEEARKLLKVAQTEAVKARLRGLSVGKSSISYADFARICCDGTNQEQGFGLARALDDSGAVLVFGDIVFLRPDQVAKAVERAIPISAEEEIDADDDPRREELREMERRKAEIDRRAAAGVRREMWWGLAFLAAQTAGFARLTFWELSWDVMEPICFYFTSAYFMAGYAFFLRTSRDPSFEGFFESRFAAKQRHLMRAAGFDSSRLHELRRTFPSASAGLADPSPPPPFHHHHDHHRTAAPLLEFSYPSSSFTCNCRHHHQRRDTPLGAL